GGRDAVLRREGGGRPAAAARGQAEAAKGRGGPAAQSAVDVDLLVGGRPVAAVFLRRPVRGRLHRGEDLPRQSSAADRIEGHRGAGGGERLDQVVHELGRRRVAHVGGADPLQEVDVLRPA